MLVLPSCCLPKLQCAEQGQPLPDTFNGAASAESSAHISWRDFFSDPALTGLIDQALAGNQELKIRNQEVRISNNEIMARIGEYLPFFNLGASAGIEKSSRFTREGAVEDQLDVAPGKGFPEPLPDFLVAADVSWEIDIWRKLRNAKDAAIMRYFATAEGRNYYVTRLIAEVAENYYELLALDNRLRTLDATIAIQERSLEMAEAKKQAARGTELAVQRFQAEVRKNQSERLIIQQEIIEAENRINLLAGRFPQPVERQSVNYIDLTLPPLSVGVPSQLLQNRADIRQAERELAAAGLDVRVARARFYPSLTLHAGVGYQAFNTKYLFVSPESLIYNAAGDLVAPVINRRAIKADYLNANARQLQAVYEYQQVILTAFTEVINYLAKVNNYGQSIELKKQQLASLEASVDAAINLFQNARVEYVEVLLAQRDLMEVRLVLIDTKRQQLIAIVNAYQALGGGGAAVYELPAGGAGNPTEEIIPLQQPLQLRPGEEVIPPAEAPAEPEPELLPPV
ncbi:MAG TPA: TolC family protein [Lacipirellula sp.]